MRSAWEGRRAEAEVAQEPSAAPRVQRIPLDLVASPVVPQRRERGVSVPVILGASEYLLKPVLPELLVEVVLRALANRY